MKTWAFFFASRQMRVCFVPLLGWKEQGLCIWSSIHFALLRLCTLCVVLDMLVRLDPLSFLAPFIILGNHLWRLNKLEGKGWVDAFSVVGAHWTLVLMTNFMHQLHYAEMPSSLIKHYFWGRLWVCLWKRLAFASADWVKKIHPPQCRWHHLSHWGPE